MNDDNNRQGHVYVNETVEKEHGRIETRRTVLSKKLDWLEQKNQWPGLKTVAMVESTREMSKKITRERRYYLCSLTNVEQVAQTIREHWSIENKQPQFGIRN